MLEYERITKYTLWFDVEKKYKTMRRTPPARATQLWFDVEKKYKTIIADVVIRMIKLWFDVEKGIRQYL